MISVAFMKGRDVLRFKAQDIDNERYYQLPKGLFSYKRYHRLSVKAKVIYAVLKDRMCLSRKNGWVETNGDIFLMFSYGELAEILAMSKTAICREFKKLVDFGLVETVAISNNGAQKIYVNRIEIPETMEDVHDYEEKLGKAEMDAQEGEARGMVADAYSKGINMSINEDRSKVSMRIKAGRSENGTPYSVLETACSENGTPRFAGETPRSDIGTPHSENGTAPVPKSELNETDLYSYTELERQKRETDNKTTTSSTGTPPAAEMACDPFQKVIRSYRDNISPMVGPVVTNELAKLCQEYGLKQVNDSITEAALSAKGEVSVKYLRAILSRWSKEGKEKAPRAASMSNKSTVAETAPEPEEVYDDEGNPLPLPLPGENAQEYFNRVGISV